MSLHCTVAGWLLGPPSGANRRLLALLRHVGPLLEHGERVTVLHRPAFAPPALRRIAWRAVDVPTGPVWRRAFAEQRLLPGLLAELGATVHDHGFLPPPRLRGVPLCLTVHDVRAADGETRWPRWFARSVLRRACRRARAVITPSEWTAARVAALAPAAPAATVVPNAVEVPAAADDERDVARPLPPSGYLLHVGHVEARKNLGVLVDALAQLPPERRPELWLAGRDAGALADLEARARERGVADAVRALGVVDDDELDALYRRARAVVLPSRYEGFGMPALEALARGRPVLAARAGALPEVVGDDGVLLPPDAPDAWARAIRDGARDDDDARAARRRAATRGDRTWSASARAVLTAWRALTASRS